MAVARVVFTLHMLIKMHGIVIIEMLIEGQYLHLILMLLTSIVTQAAHLREYMKVIIYRLSFSSRFCALCTTRLCAKLQRTSALQRLLRSVDCAVIQVCYH
jgi:hypothetical protein